MTTRKTKRAPTFRPTPTEFTNRFVPYIRHNVLQIPDREQTSYDDFNHNWKHFHKLPGIARIVPPSGWCDVSYEDYVNYNDNHNHNDNERSSSRCDGENKKRLGVEAHEELIAAAAGEGEGVEGTKCSNRSHYEELGAGNCYADYEDKEVKDTIRMDKERHVYASREQNESKSSSSPLCTVSESNEYHNRGNDIAKWKAVDDILIPNPIQQNIATGKRGVYEYNMVECKPLTIREFREKARDYRRKIVGQVKENYCEEDKEAEQRMEELAWKFWRRLSPDMPPPMYGADVPGTLFGDANASGWNVNHLDSILHLLAVDRDDNMSLPGVTTAYLYAGMYGSVFAAHTEDMNLMSINHLHCGAPKYWYAISPEDAERFESLLQSLFPDRFMECPEFIRHKLCMVSPKMIEESGIPYTTCIQFPGDTVITLPSGYHFGFNTGFNIAESTNFALEEWIPYGLEAKICKCTPFAVRFDMQRFVDLFFEYLNTHKNNPGCMCKSFRGYAKQLRDKRMLLQKNLSNNILEATEQDLSLQSSPLSFYASLDGNWYKAIRICATGGNKILTNYKVGMKVIVMVYTPKADIKSSHSSNNNVAGTNLTHCTKSKRSRIPCMASVVKVQQPSYVKVKYNSLRMESAWWNVDEDFLYSCAGQVSEEEVLAAGKCKYTSASNNNDSKKVTITKVDDVSSKRNKDTNKFTSKNDQHNDVKFRKNVVTKKRQRKKKVIDEGDTYAKYYRINKGSNRERTWLKSLSDKNDFFSPS